MWATITKPFAWLMLWLYDITGNYGVALLLFALAVNLILAPFMAKSKKSTMRTTRLQPRMQELQRRHEGNQQKLNEEMQKLYREEGINPMSGCLWSLIPFPILIALYSVIRQPLTRMMFLAQEAADALQNFFVAQNWYAIPAKADAYSEIALTNIVHQHWNEVQNAITSGAAELNGFDFSRLQDIDYSFLGMNMGSVPNFRFWAFDFSDASKWGPALGLLLIPVISALLSWLSMKVGNMSNPAQDTQTQASMQSMNLMMPLMSLWFCFIMPAAMGIYWIANSVFGMARDVVLTKIFKMQLDKEDADRIEARNERERQLELNRLETERKRAEGISEANLNTSKKKIQANQKQKSNERKAAIIKEEKAARREMLGIEEYEVPASQVGNRRYARGRAYDPNRFSISEEDIAGKTAEIAVETPETVEDVTEKIDMADGNTAAETVKETVDGSSVEVTKEENL